MSKPVTLKQIAAAVNTSVSTVSMALSDHPHISPVTKVEIQKIAKQMGYSPNLIARKLSSRKKRTIGLVVPKVAHPFFSEAIEAIYDEAHHQSYEIFMMVSGEDAALEAHHIKTLLGLQVDGFLISVTEKTADLSPFESILSKNKKLVFLTALSRIWDAAASFAMIIKGAIISFLLHSTMDIRRLAISPAIPTFILAGNGVVVLSRH